MTARLAVSLLVVALTVTVDAFVIHGAVFGDYPATANRFPFIAAGALTILCIAILVAPRSAVVPAEGDGAAGDEEPPTLAAYTRAGLLLLAVLPVILLAGFRVGLPAYALVYALLGGARPWQAALSAGFVALLVEVVFVRILTLRLPAGAIASWIGG